MSLLALVGAFAAAWFLILLFLLSLLRVAARAEARAERERMEARVAELAARDFRAWEVEL